MDTSPLPGIRSQEEWDQENLQAFRNIDRSVQELHDLVPDAVAALKETERNKPSLSLQGMPEDLIAYKDSFSRGVHVNLELIADVKYARREFEKIKKKAEKLDEILHRDDDKKEPEEFKRPKVLKKVRAKIKAVKEAPIEWEKKNSKGYL